MNNNKIYVLHKNEKALSIIVLCYLFILMPLLEKKYFIFSQLISQIVILISLLFFYLLLSDDKIIFSLGSIEIVFIFLAPLYLISALAHDNKYQVFLIFYDLFIYSIFMLLIKKIILINNLNIFLLILIISGDILSILKICNSYNLLNHLGFANNNLSAIYIFNSLLIIINFLRNKNSKSILQNLLLYLSLILTIIAEILLSSRSIYFIAIIILILVGINMTKKKIRASLLMLVIIFLIISIVGLIIKFADSPYKWQRLKIWWNTAIMIKDNLLLGVGPGNYQLAAYKYNFPTYESIHSKVCFVS